MHSINFASWIKWKTEKCRFGICNCVLITILHKYLNENCLSFYRFVTFISNQFKTIWPFKKLQTKEISIKTFDNVIQNQISNTSTMIQTYSMKLLFNFELNCWCNVYCNCYLDGKYSMLQYKLLIQQQYTICVDMRVLLVG